jgi:predicted O-methyltransferase YrrM
MVTPVPMPSETAFYVLKQLGVSLDLVHVDAGHEYRSALTDLKQYWSLLRPGGILIGDDYSAGWPGVKRAADEFAVSTERSLEISGNKFVLRK